MPVVVFHPQVLLAFCGTHCYKTLHYCSSRTSNPCLSFCSLQDSYYYTTVRTVALLFWRYGKKLSRGQCPTFCFFAHIATVGNLLFCLCPLYRLGMKTLFQRPLNAFCCWQHPIRLAADPDYVRVVLCSLSLAQLLAGPPPPSRLLDRIIFGGVQCYRRPRGCG